MRITRRSPLAARTTLGVGGEAEVLVEVAGGAREVTAALEAVDGAVGAGEVAGEASAGSASEVSGPVAARVLLGEGSNVVVSDHGLAGTTLVLRGGGVGAVESCGAAVRVTADGGMPWDDLVAWAVDEELAGIELLSGIPGTVGAAPVQNIGAYGQALDETFVALEAVDRRTGERVTLGPGDCAFGYRDSRFKRDWQDRYIIAEVTLELSRTTRSPLAYRDLDLHFQREGGDPQALADRRAAVLAVRRAKSMVVDPGDPFSRSAGSFFMSPWLPREQAIALVDGVRGPGAGERLFSWYSGADAEEVKVPAAMVLLAAGFANGDRWGTVGLSPRHVLAIVNLGGASAQQVADLAGHIRATVAERLDVTLRPEPRFLGEFADFDPERFAAWARYTPGDGATPSWARDAVR